jgi:hypothetical protein
VQLIRPAVVVEANRPAGPAIFGDVGRPPGSLHPKNRLANHRRLSAAYLEDATYSNRPRRPQPHARKRRSQFNEKQTQHTKSLDGCRSLIHTEEALRRFAPN